MKQARYLLRFDDLCPTMDRERWARFAQLIREFGIRPILAVVPDNQDPELNRAPADPDFWAEMRDFQAAGAAIGLHGLHHRCTASGPGLIPLHSHTEFAGAPEAEQRASISAGLAILRGHGLEPSIWVAPRHGMDHTTLKVLREEGIPVLSDGFAEAPFQYGGLLWLPQQLWGPVEKKSGLWTICLHANSASETIIEELGRFLTRFGPQFTSVQQVLAEVHTGQPVPDRSLADRWFHRRMMVRIWLSRLKKSFKSWLRLVQ